MMENSGDKLQMLAVFWLYRTMNYQREIEEISVKQTKTVRAPFGWPPTVGSVKISWQNPSQSFQLNTAHPTSLSSHYLQLENSVQEVQEK